MTSAWPPGDAGAPSKAIAEDILTMSSILKGGELPSSLLCLLVVVKYVTSFKEEDIVEICTDILTHVFDPLDSI